MAFLTECPNCGHVGESNNVVSVTDKKVMAIRQTCDQCGEHYEDQYKIRWLGRTSYGCNLFPAEGETEESMRFAGVELDE